MTIPSPCFKISSGKPLPSFSKTKSYEVNKPVLEKIYLSDVLPTVSNRNEKLKEVNFWTSGNRVYKCNNVGVIKEILRFRSIKSFEKCLLKFSKYKNLVNLIENIINKEYEEYGQYWE